MVITNRKALLAIMFYYQLRSSPLAAVIAVGAIPALRNREAVHDLSIGSCTLHTVGSGIRVCVRGLTHLFIEVRDNIITTDVNLIHFR